MPVVQIFGHPRSGTHFVAAMIDQNFFDGKDYLRHYQRKYPHIMGNKLDNVKKPNWNVIYVYREMNEVLDSMFRMRDRFGLRVDDYSTFLNTKYKNMWTDNIEGFEIKANFLHTQKKSTNIAKLFKDVDMYPEEYWAKHVDSWFQRNDVTLVHYNRLKDYPENELKRIAKGINKPIPEEIQYIDQQVGWIPLTEGGKYKDDS